MATTTIQPGFLARTWRALTKPTMKSKIMRSLAVGAPTAAVAKLLGAGWGTSLGAGALAGTAAWHAPKLDENYKRQQKLLALKPQLQQTLDTIYYTSALSDYDPDVDDGLVDQINSYRNGEQYRNIQNVAAVGDQDTINKLQDQWGQQLAERRAAARAEEPGYGWQRFGSRIFAQGTAELRALLQNKQEQWRKQKKINNILARLVDSRFRQAPWWAPK